MQARAYSNLSAAVILASCAVATASSAQVVGRSALTGLQSIKGQVTDSGSNPLPGVEVSVVGTELRAVTDSLGNFRLSGPLRDVEEVHARRVGYQPVSVQVKLVSDSNTTAIRMIPLNVLASVEVRAQMLSERLVRTGFPERQRRGVGEFVGPQSIDSMARHTQSASSMLRGVAGVEVSCGSASRCSVRPKRAQCLHLFVNGQFRPGVLDDWVPAHDVYAFEVYPSANRVPAEFQGPLTQRGNNRVNARAGCGALVVWTKSRVIE